MNVDDCAPKHGSWEPYCLNGGQCLDGIGRYTCSCPPGFVGEHCEGDLNECLSGPCHSTGSLDCVQLVNDYQCHCRLGYTGREIFAFFCKIISIFLVFLFMTVYNLQFLSTVNDLMNFLALSLQTSGRHCDSMVDPCLSKPCRNGGVCSMNMTSVHGYMCSCPPVRVLFFNLSI